MSIYMEYLTGDDRKYALEMAKLETEYGNLQRLYEMTELQLETYKANAEITVFEKDGTYDDLEYLYTEAENAVQEDQRNILQRIFDWFKNFFANIGKAIRASFGKIDPNAEVQVDKNDLQGNPNQASGMLSRIISIINPVKDEDGVKKLDIAKLGAEIAAVAVGGAVGAKVFTKIKAGELMKKIDERIKFTENCSKVVEAIKSKLNQLNNVPFINTLTDALKKALDVVKKSIIDPVNAKINVLWDALKGVGGVVANAAQDVAGTVKDTAAGAVNAVKDAVTPAPTNAAQKAQKAMNNVYSSAEDEPLADGDVVTTENENDIFSVQMSIFGEEAIAEAEEDPDYAELAELFSTI